MASAAERLREAEDARHLLLVGEASAELQFGERRVRFQVTDLARLDQYIAQLKQDAAVEAGGRAAPRRRGVIFGGG